MEGKAKKDMRGRLGMAIGYAGGVPLYILIAAYLIYFYTNVVGLNAGVIGSILLVSKVMDGISDILFGAMIDRSRSKWGVARPWILRMSFLALLSIAALFAVPAVGDVAKYVYVFISYNVANTVVYTILQLSIISLPTYMTRDSLEQSKIYVWANSGQFVMQFILSSIMFKAVTAAGGTQKAWLLVSTAIGVVGLVLLLIAFALCKETVNPDELAKAVGHEAKVPLSKALKAVAVNKYWWMILGFVTLGSGVYATTATMSPYYAQYILGNTTIADTLNACYTFPMMIACPFFLFLLGKFGKRTIALTGVLIQTLGTLIVLLLPTSMPALIVGAVLKSLGFSAPTSCYCAMLGDSIEYGQWKTGVRSQAILMGAQSTGAKIGTGLITSALSWIIAGVGFNGMQAVQGAAVLSTISRLYTIIPLVLSALMVVILSLYDLDRKYPQIMADLKERELDESK